MKYRKDKSLNRFVNEDTEDVRDMDFVAYGEIRFNNGTFMYNPRRNKTPIWRIVSNVKDDDNKTIHMFTKELNEEKAIDILEKYGFDYVE